MRKKRRLVLGAVATVAGAAGAVAVLRKSGRKKNASVTLYRSSRKSKTLHQEDCRYYDARSLAQVFNSLDEAGEAGYRPCTICMS
jgi:methylphosphotriester-DNA--protein-cysteine methyltransferase